MIPHQEKERLEHLVNVFKYYDYPLIADIISVIKQGLDARFSDNEIKQSIGAPKEDIPIVEVCDT